jgi:hypothetical protein
MTNIANALVINTGLNDSASLNVLKSTLGQLSDGIWENSRKAERYWPFANAEMVDGNVCIVISKEYSKRYGSGKNSWGYSNGFIYDLAMDEAKIKNYFSRKVAEVVRQEAKDNPNRGIKCTSKCEVALDYMSDYENDENEIRACDAYKVYKALKVA